MDARTAGLPHPASEPPGGAVPARTPPPRRAHLQPCLAGGSQIASPAEAPALLRGLEKLSGLWGRAHLGARSRADTRRPGDRTPRSLLATLPLLLGISQAPAVGLSVGLTPAG